MNNKFYNLALDRQKQIINGALKVFAASSYRQASTIDIAEEAGISKGLLFHYFKNKKELYLYLYEYCINLAINEIEGNRDIEETDFFQILMHSQRSKCKLMKEHRYMYDFLVKVYTENDLEMVEEIVQYSRPWIASNFRQFLDKVDTSNFKDGVDVPLLFQSIQWCSDGFMRSTLHNKSIDEMDEEFTRILEMYKQNFYK
ncbi:AcrR family transcriptional regulator [Paenibacillus anaericanus]|uniref:TetR/AcrR family transcriptional regulator n=1 Tax=Paenibacillus anaericanus TaxID=170367 RepID=UPI00278678E4|nr:TetR/AcrR family transcriptional regulator [Paenibacillus anaericanus]MDQ0087560.1 AcrR family transcriptional regulator [Paenibacillus anaericanus]